MSINLGNEWYETTAKYDWFVTRKANALHYARLTPDQCVQLQENGIARGAIKLYCGIRVPMLTIPGVLNRLGLYRCKRCCKMLHIPPGLGSPRNDPECRKILGLPPRKEEDYETLE